MLAFVRFFSFRYSIDNLGDALARLRDHLMEQMSEFRRGAVWSSDFWASSKWLSPGARSQSVVKPGLGGLDRASRLRSIPDLQVTPGARRSSASDTVDERLKLGRLRRARVLEGRAHQARVEALKPHTSLDQRHRVARLASAHGHERVKKRCSRSLQVAVSWARTAA